MEWFLYWKISWTHWRLRHVACIIFSLPFFTQRKECGGFPQIPKIQWHLLVMWENRVNLCHLTKRHYYIRRGIDWQTSKTFFFPKRQRQRCIHNRWLAAQYWKGRRLLFMCVCVRRCQPSSERIVWFTKKSMETVVKGRTLPRGSYDFNNVSYGTGSGKLSGLTLTWQQQQM